MGHSKNVSKNETKSYREGKGKRLAKAITLTVPIIGYGIAIFREPLAEAFRPLIGAHLVVVRSEIKPGPSVVPGLYAYEGTLSIMNKGPAAGHHLKFAVVAPPACRLGEPHVATWPTTSGPHMAPEHLPFATGLRIDSEIWKVDFWRKREVLMLRYPLACSHPLPENLRLNFDKLSDTADITSMSSRERSSQLSALGNPRRYQNRDWASALRWSRTALWSRDTTRRFPPPSFRIRPARSNRRRNASSHRLRVDPPGTTLSRS